MLRRFGFLALMAVAVALGTSSYAHAWGGCHAGFAHVGFRGGYGYGRYGYGYGRYGYGARYGYAGALGAYGALGDYGYGYPAYGYAGYTYGYPYYVSGYPVLRTAYPTYTRIW